MSAILSLLVVIVVSMLVVRIATVALILTGLSSPLARFQARSAFTGSGFTTSESEQVVSHPVRRRIIMLMMLMGNAGIVTAISSLMLSFMGSDDSNPVYKVLFLFAALLLLWFVAHSKWVDRQLDRLIRYLLVRYSKLELRDYEGLLHLGGGYVVAELQVGKDDWLANRTLLELRLMDEGVMILGIERHGGVYSGAPRGDTKIAPYDTLLLYGQSETIENLDSRDRSEGNWEHFCAVTDQARRDRNERGET